MQRNNTCPYIRTFTGHSFISLINCPTEHSSIFGENQNMYKGGRNCDPVWENFNKIELDGKILAKCKRCGHQQSNKVQRMKSHAAKCFETLPAEPTKRKFHAEESEPDIEILNPPSRKPKLQSNIKVTITSQEQKDRLDALVAKFFFACNIPFSVVEHEKFIELVEALRPGYRLPSRKQLSGSLLDKVYENLQDTMKYELDSKECTLIQDGWSNIHNDPVVAHVIHTENKSFFISSKDTGSHSKTGEYCKQLAKEAIKTSEEKYNCQVTSLVTDNAKNMDKMKMMLQEENEDLLVYGCSAHWLNLLGGDLTPPNIMKHITDIQKYFRNHHHPSAWLSEHSGSVKPQIPGQTRWNSQLVCLDTFIKNRPHMIDICEEHEGDIDPGIVRKIHDYNLYKQAKDMFNQLEPVAVALNQAQGDSTTIAETCNTWLGLLVDPAMQSHKEKVMKRFNQAITPFHMAAYLMHPKYKGEKLSAEQVDIAHDWLASKDPTYMPAVIAFQAESIPYPASYFSSAATVTPASIWWKSIEKRDFPPGFVPLMIRLHRLPASSASVERVFSSFGLIHSKLRNRLGVEKASKLVFCYRLLRGKNELDY